MEVLGGDDLIVDDVFDVGLGGELAQGGVVVGGVGLDGDDAEVFVALDETSSGRARVGLCVTGNGGVAVEDEVAVRCDGGDLCVYRRGEAEEQKREGQRKWTGSGGSGVVATGHGYTSRKLCWGVYRQLARRR